jgi:hypothetical protein
MVLMEVLIFPGSIHMLEAFLYLFALKAFTKGPLPKFQRAEE